MRRPRKQGTYRPGEDGISFIFPVLVFSFWLGNRISPHCPLSASDSGAEWSRYSCQCLQVRPCLWDRLLHPRRAHWRLCISEPHESFLQMAGAVRAQLRNHRYDCQTICLSVRLSRRPLLPRLCLSRLSISATGSGWPAWRICDCCFWDPQGS